jgi:NADH:ubiquinone oxidoreductase subunit 5 (subunit L)/multisubunit Na+/H+ antiporter MnhA subunit
MTSQPVIGWILLLGVTLTGVYIGRLFGIVYLSEASDPHAVHHDPSSERHMNWSIVPLMIGSVVLGWAGYWLRTALEGPLGPIEPLPPLLNLTGGLAFVLGAAGFVGAAWYVRRPSYVAAPTETSYRADAWVRAIADAGYAATGALARVQSGVLPRYAFGSILAVALILLVRVSVR